MTQAAAALIRALQNPGCYPHPVVGPRLIETHISWVILTGDYAYKIKKPLDLGFANFTTLKARRRYCQEEVRLNRRLAPQLYLDVVAIRGARTAPHVGGKGPILEYAVKMREFPREALATYALTSRRFGADEIDALAATIAGFHAAAITAPPGGPFGTPTTLLAACRQNFEQILPLVTKQSEHALLRELREWSEREHSRSIDAFEARAAGGFVRECHGDLHLGNVALLERHPVPFDCIEFSEELRYIDVMSDVAFMVMDLHDRKRSRLAWRFLNRYLEATGDYPGLKVLRFYLVYRALVRAKIHLIRAHQPKLARKETVRLAHAFHRYLLLARRLVAPSGVSLTITHGLSGSGKTTVTEALAARLGALRLRSDLERKRLHRLAPLAASGSPPGSGIYSREATVAVYRRLGALARVILRAGWPVLVDATFLKHAEREAFRSLAAALDVPFRILNFRMPVSMLRARVAARRARSDNASEADLDVLERQIGIREPLTRTEMASTVTVEGTGASCTRCRRNDGKNVP